MLARIARLYAVEADIRGQAADARRGARQERSRPLIDDLRRVLEMWLDQVSRKGRLAEAIRYALNHWNGLCRSDDGGDNWAVIASLIETAKLNRVYPQAWLTDTLKRFANGHRINALGDLMPWTYAVRVPD